MEATDDANLVIGALSGDPDAFNALVRRWRRPAVARALAILADPAEAEDVAQEAFVHGYAELATCRRPASFGAWLLTIVRNRALNRLRTIRRRRTIALAPDVSTDSGIETGLDRGELRDRLLGALRQLSDVQREVVLLADLEQWPHARIAETLRISVTMSRRHLSDARRKLRILLEPRHQ